MKRWWLLAGLALLALAVAAPAQDGVLQGYVRDNLELISQQSLPTWSARWTGPIEAATILAWLTENGYSQFVRDLNGDGVVDEQDTILLADDLGRMLMATESPRGTTDARLVLGLAQYVASLYPNEFVLKIYDMGFPNELLAEGLGAYSPTMVPGILLEVKEAEPSIEAYKEEMENAEGVILGLNDIIGQNNTYLAGRSFLFSDTAEGYTPIDLALSEEDRWQSGFQGQVLETVGRSSDQFYLDFHGQWTPVEFMLALSPEVHHESYGSPAPCPQNAIAYDVTESATAYGRVRIAECVTREVIVGGPTLDTYTYSVTNIDFQNSGCGVCTFFVPDTLGLTTVDMSGPDYWMAYAGWSGWWWKAPNWSCGIPIGLTGVFSLTVVGPTFDTPVTGAVGACSAGASPKTVAVSGPLLPVRTTGPGKQGVPDDGDHPGGDCPDLTVEVRTEDCSRSPTGGGGEITVVVKVTNIGSATSDGTVLRFESSMDDHTSMVPSLDPGESVNKTFTLTFTANHPPSCPFEYTATVDPYNNIIECDEENNAVESSLLCPWCIG